MKYRVVRIQNLSFNLDLIWIYVVYRSKGEFACRLKK